MTENTIIPMVFYDILDQTTVFGKMYMLAMHVLSLTTCTCNKYDSCFFLFFHWWGDIDVRIKNNIYKCNWALVTYAQLSNALVYMHVFVTLLILSVLVCWFFIHDSVAEAANALYETAKNTVTQVSAETEAIFSKLSVLTDQLRLPQNILQLIGERFILKISNKY